jgi:hypothetical protein
LENGIEISTFVSLSPTPEMAESSRCLLTVTI